MLSLFTLEGHGVRLEPLSAGHAVALAHAGAGDRASYGYTWVPDGADDARRYVESALALRDAGRAVPFAVRRLSAGGAAPGDGSGDGSGGGSGGGGFDGAGVIVGATRFLDLDVFTWPPPWPPGVGAGPEPSDENPPTVAEIGSTWYASSAQRTGVNTACKLLMLTHAFEAWRARRVTLKTDARNKASRVAIDRIGGRFEGVRRAHVPASDGTMRDTAYFSIIDSEWPAVRDHLRRLLAQPRTGWPGCDPGQGRI